MSDGLRISIDDMLKAGFCGRGVRRFYNERGLDFQTLMRGGGTPAAVLLATGDARAILAVERTIRRQSVDG